MKDPKELENPEKWYFMSLENLVKSGLTRTEARKVLKEGYRIMINDPLTGVCNRRMLFRRLEREINLVNEKRPLSVIMLDIDDFKKYNDTYGHLQGDLAIKQVTQAIVAVTEYKDFVARYGGEEFTLVLPKTSLKEARIIAERIRKNIEGMIITASSEELPNGFEKTTISQGIAQYIEDTHKGNIEYLLADADHALYKAKAREKKNAISVY